MKSRLPPPRVDGSLAVELDVPPIEPPAFGDSVSNSCVRQERDARFDSSYAITPSRLHERPLRERLAEMNARVGIALVTHRHESDAEAPSSHGGGVMRSCRWSTKLFTLGDR